MDIYNMVMKIPYVLMLLVGVTMILQLYVGGLNSLSMDIEQYNQDKFRAAVVLENTLSVEERPNEIGFNYDHRRAVTPIKFYNQQASGPDDSGEYGIGYKKRNNEYCYIPRVAGLDGQNFGFYIRSLDTDMSVNLDCTSRPSDRSETVFSPVLLVRNSGPPVPARLYIYAR